MNARPHCARVKIYGWLRLVIGCGLWLAGSLALAQATAGDDEVASLLQKEEAAFRAAVELAAPSVVQIETFGGLQRVGEELIAEGPTTGTIVDGDGWIVSSLYGFRQQPSSILVTLPDGQRAAARLVARDLSRELVLLKVEVEQALPAATAADIRSVAVGSWTIAVGKTYDKSQVSQSAGIISALGRAYGKAVQTDAKVSPINYGGPLIDLHGHVIGILAPISPGTFFDGDSSELYDSGIGFAIPLTDILARLARMQQGEDIREGKLGVVSSDQNEMAGPVRLTGASPGSPAAKVGVEAEDVIIEAEGKPVKLLAELRHALAQVDAGDTFHFAVRRAGKRLEMQCELVAEVPVYRRRYVGLRLAQGDQEVTVTAIEPDSPAAGQPELKVGDRLLECNGQKISTIADFAGQLAVAELDTPLELKMSGADEASKSIDLLAVTWPTTLPAGLPAVDASVDASLPVETIELPLGDLPNVAYAVVPPRAAKRRLGLMIVFPEPGELDRQRTQQHWESFCRDHGWLVVVVQSSNPRGWSLEEVELSGRLIGMMDQAYQLDPARCVISGWGVGGRVALAAATLERQRVSGVMTLGTDWGRVNSRQVNAPLQSLDFLLVGDPQKLEAPATALTGSGYAANVVPAGQMEAGRWETAPLESIQRWLEGLGRL